MEIFIANADDWEGLYINGYLVTEGHSISNKELAMAIIDRLPRTGISYESKEVDPTWMSLNSTLPQELSKVKFNG